MILVCSFEMKRLLFVFTLIAINYVYVNGLSLKLLPYRQEDSDTNCTHGLISDIDTVVFKAELDYSQDVNFKYIYCQRKTTTDQDFIFLKDIVVNSSVIDQSTWEQIGKHDVKITVRVKANKLSSRARIRCVLLSSNYQEIISDEQIFPEIRDTTDINSRLLINGEEIKTPHMCVTRATGTDIVVIFECDSQVLPCLIEITATDLMVPLFGKGYVIHTSRRPVLNITIKYASCTLKGQVNTIKCSINLDDSSSNKETDINVLNKALFGIIAIMATVIIVLIALLLRKGKWQRHVMVPRFMNCIRKMKSVDSNDDNDMEEEIEETGEVEPPINLGGRRRSKVLEEETDHINDIEPLLKFNIRHQVNNRFQGRRSSVPGDINLAKHSNVTLKR
ncbi:unnamed protein product [Lymnaea stagnalis]|uniref:Uncharacterized protein n=1 Tax=Lymnaea stagnalis TaxID=6523 RepID=A0AAV2HBK2_LYMST